MQRALTIIGAIALGALGMRLFDAKSPSESLPQPALISLEGMGHLVSVKVNYANVIEFTENITQGIPWTQWELRFGGTRVLLVARGDCLVSTDIRLARYEEINEAARTATVVLPMPGPVSARVNHDSREKGGSYFYAVNGTGLEPLIPGSANRTRAIDIALKRAQQDLEQACRGAEVLATARRNTEAVLKSTLLAIGWKVQVRWLAGG